MRINALVAKAQKMPEEGWTMQDGTPWPGNNPRDHPGMIQVLSSVHAHTVLSFLFTLLLQSVPNLLLCIILNRSSWATVEVLILMEMSCLDLFMFLVRSDRASNITRKPVP